MLQYSQFYRQHGVFRREFLAQPRTEDTQNMELPIGPVVHYLPQDIQELGPDATYWMIRNTDKPIWMEHVTALETNFGTPRRKPGDPMILIREFHRRNKRFQRMLTPGTALSNAQSVMVINYAIANHLYTYPNNMFLEYQRNMNFRDTVWANVGKYAEQFDRQHFIPLQMPDLLPSLLEVQRAEKKTDRDTIRKFTQLSRIFFLDIWKWLGEHRDESPISKLSPVARSRVNLVFVVRNHWFVANIGDLEQFRRSADNPKAPYDSLQMQKRFMRGVVTLVEQGAVGDRVFDTLGDDVKKPNPADPVDRSLVPNPVAAPQPEEMASLPNLPQSLNVPTQPLNQINEGAYVSRAGLAASDSIEARPLSKDTQVQQQAVARGTDRAAAELLKAQQTELSDEQLERDIEAVQEVEQIAEMRPALAVPNPNADPLVSGVVERAEKLAREGLISGPEYRRLQKLAEVHKQIKNPFGPGTLVEASKVTPEEVVVKPRELKVKGQVFDPSMTKTTLNDVTRQYVKHTLHKDVANMVLNVQRAGIAVTDFQVVKTQSVLGSQNVASVRFNPVNGVPSTWRFTYPDVKEDGTFKAGGTRYRMRWQRRDKPIRKIAPGRVALSSYYGKVAVNLSERAINDYTRWLGNNLTAMLLDSTNPRLKGVVEGRVFDQSLKVPKIYSQLSRRFVSLQLDELLLNFDYSRREELYPGVNLKALEGDGVVAGRHTDGRYVVIDPASHFTLVDPRKGTLDDLGLFEDLVGLDRSTAPMEVVLVRILGNSIPLAFALGFYYGLTNLISQLGATTRRVLAGDRMNLAPHEIPIRFSDETLIIDSREQLSTMVLGGLRNYATAIRQISIYSMDREAAYVSLLDASTRNAKYTSELETLRDMFIDPITRDDLLTMKEPTEWIPLLMRAAELLKTEYSPDETDGDEMLIKGYERLAGTVYKEMVQGVRMFKHRNRISKAGIDIKPTAVWTTINKDAAVSIVDEANPVQDARAAEAVTYIGNGGRSKRSMVARTRRFHKNDPGTISEATVDSGDVGINIYLTANPQIVSTRGFTQRGSKDTTGISSLVSTAAMLAPAADVDDPKRVNFIGIQHGSGVAAVGYKPMPYRTGMESVLAHRDISKLFSYTATGDGEVVSLRNQVLKVKYASGEVVGLPVGRQFGKSAGHQYPNDLIATVKVGDKVAEGDVLIYNEAFFAPDRFNARQVIYKHGVPTRIALCEAPGTLEDSSIISEKVSKAMRSYETETREIQLDFKTAVRDLVKVGDRVEADSILCTLEDPSSEAASLFSDDTVDTLRLLANNAPKAKVAGVVDKIEVYYYGDIEDMSPSLRAIAEASDAQIFKTSRDLGEEVTSGRLTEELRVNNNPLPLDNLVIYISITHGRDAFAGDKGTFGNQGKSVFGRVMTGENVTESGLEIDAIFSDKSFEDRIVESPRILGMSNSLLIRITQNVISAYRGG